VSPLTNHEIAEISKKGGVNALGSLSLDRARRFLAGATVVFARARARL
jgi:hypothetical protein